MDAERKRNTIIIAEDSAVVRRVWALIMQTEFPGYEVVACGDGEQGLSVAQARRDTRLIITTDFDMGPGHMNGIEFTEAVRESGLSAPVVMISAIAGEIRRCYRERMAACGIVALHSKPADLDRVLEDMKIIDRRYEEITQGSPLRPAA